LARVALLSNPRSTGNRSLLPKIRNFCAANPDIFHYEVDDIGQIDKAMASIALVKPKLIVINGGDGTVQAALTEIYAGTYFDHPPPPVAVLPNGKTNLIALDLGADGDPLKALERIVMLAQGDISPYIVERELIALSEGEDHLHATRFLGSEPFAPGANPTTGLPDRANKRPVLGMFLGGAGLADTILYCRHKIYPLGLPNGLSHVIAGFAVLLSEIFGLRASFLPPPPNPVRVSLIREGHGVQRFSFLIVTTLERLLLGSNTGQKNGVGLKLLAVEQSGKALIKALWAGMMGTLGKRELTGVHVQQGDVIRIESDMTNVILDGETFSATRDNPIVLRSTRPVPFFKLAA
jgi:Diacylglycerol kinase catalytic domain